MRLMTWPALSARSSPRVLLDGESLVAAAADLVVVVQAASNVSMAAPGAKEEKEIQRRWSACSQ